MTTQTQNTIQETGTVVGAEDRINPFTDELVAVNVTIMDKWGRVFTALLDPATAAQATSTDDVITIEALHSVDRGGKVELVDVVRVYVY